LEVGQRVRLHHPKIEDFIVGVRWSCVGLVVCMSCDTLALLTSPRRAPKDHSVLGDRLEALLQHLEDVAFDPPDLLRHSIQLSVVLGTC